jgi:hypothetical protein
MIQNETQTKNVETQNRLGTRLITSHKKLLYDP